MPAEPIHYGEATVIPDPFMVKNCGPYAVDQLDKLIGALLMRGTQFMQAKEAALLVGEG